MFDVNATRPGLTASEWFSKASVADSGVPTDASTTDGEIRTLTDWIRWSYCR